MSQDPGTDGILLVDKPAGISSHGAVDRVRRRLGIRRIGHAGTLDPFATGLLILLVGRATRLLPYLDAEPKVYRATIRFGRRTTTDDLTGEPVHDAPVPEEAVMHRGIASLTGHLLQRPPVFSAKQVAGVRAYRAARRGRPMDLEPVGVTVHRWDILGFANGDLDARVTCSGGTYVRALARDLGETTGSAAHLAALRRERSGRFDVERAQSLDVIEDAGATLLPVAEGIRQLPVRAVDDLEAIRILHGQGIAAQADSEVVGLYHGESLLAIGIRDGEQLRPRVVLRDA